MELINLGILAHVDAGKTTLTERLLYLSGAIRSMGSVDGGDAHMDNLDVEKERGISVKANSAQFEWNGISINLIDTPGHTDFAGEIERSLQVLDNAVLVISAVEGVQPQTEAIWKALITQNIPTIFYVNKTDRAGADANKVISQIKSRLKADAHRIYHSETGLFSLVKNEQIAEKLAENDELLLEKYIEKGADCFEGYDDFLIHLRKQFAQRKIFPLMCGSALGRLGSENQLLDNTHEELLEFLTQVCVRASGDAAGELSAVVYKLEHSKTFGRIAHIRVYNGKIGSRDIIINSTKETEEKVTQIKKYAGTKQKDTNVLTAGETGVICGLSSGSIGDVYGSDRYVKKKYNMTVPLISVRIFPDDEKNYPEIAEATAELNAEDPLLNMLWVKDERELVINVTGLIQMEILEKLYKNRFGLSVKFGSPSIIYKETIIKGGHGYDAYTMPKPCWAILDFLMQPLERGAGYTFENTVHAEDILERYIVQVIQTIPKALKQGPRGFEVTDIKLTLVSGQSHVMHTHPLDFAVATPLAIMNGLASIGTVLLEPILKFNITAPEHLNGKIIGEILAMRGTFDSPVIKDGLFMVEGLYPLAATMNFPNKFAAMTSGKGILISEFHSYSQCPPEVEAFRPYRGISPLDRAKYILHVRHAIQ